MVWDAKAGAMDLEDRYAIHQVISLYGHIIDDCAQDGGSWDQLDEIFTTDAIFDMEQLGHGKLVGCAAIKAAMAAGVHPSGHHMTNIVVTPASSDVAETWTKLLAPLPDGRVCTGSYRDRFVRTRDGWRIEHRSVSIRALEVAAPLPLFAGRRPAAVNHSKSWAIRGA